MKTTCIVSVRVSTETRDKWRVLASSMGMSVGKMLQDAVERRTAPKEAAPPLAPIVEKERRQIAPFTKDVQLKKVKK